MKTHFDEARLVPATTIDLVSMGYEYCPKEKDGIQVTKMVQMSKLRYFVVFGGKMVDVQLKIKDYDGHMRPCLVVPRTGPGYGKIGDICARHAQIRRALERKDTRSEAVWDAFYQKKTVKGNTMYRVAETKEQVYDDTWIPMVDATNVWSSIRDVELPNWAKATRPKKVFGMSRGDTRLWNGWMSQTSAQIRSYSYSNEWRLSMEECREIAEDMSECDDDVFKSEIDTHELGVYDLGTFDVSIGDGLVTGHFGKENMKFEMKLRSSYSRELCRFAFE